MHIGYTPEQEALRPELRAYFAELMTPEVEAEVATGDTGGPHCLEAVRKHGPRRLARASAGRRSTAARAAADRAVHLLRRGVARPRAAAGAHHQRGRAHDHGVRQRGAEAVLPAAASCAASCHFAIGYTEPNAGTDLASLRTRAVRDGDDWVINGQKIYTSLADYADYIWLAARTDPDAPKHQGISIFMVPTKAPGFSFTPIHTLVDAGTTSTFYEDVRVPTRR